VKKIKAKTGTSCGTVALMFFCFVLRTS